MVSLVTFAVKMRIMFLSHLLSCLVSRNYTLRCNTCIRKGINIAKIEKVESKNLCAILTLAVRPVGVCTH